MSKEIFVTRSSMPPYEEYIQAIRPLWNTAILTNMGVYHKRLEQELKTYLGVDHLSLFCNGHMSLELTLQAMGLTGEVITIPFTFISTTHAIIRNHLKPVFCDIDPVTYTMDFNKIEELITERTSAILPVHVYGNPCKVEEIERIAKKYHLKVIYDAAHAFGVKINGKNIGTFGDASIFSFHATKIFNTIEGGAASYQDKELGKKLYKLKNFGIESSEIVDEIGTNAKLNEFQSIMGLCNLNHMHEEIQKRKLLAERYQRNLEGLPGIQLMKKQQGVESNYAYFPIVCDELEFGATRDDIYEKLAAYKVYGRKYFYPLTADQICFRHKYDASQIPIARTISNRVLALPLYADLDLKDVDRICTIIARMKSAKRNRQVS